MQSSTWGKGMAGISEGSAGFVFAKSTLVTKEISPELFFRVQCETRQ